MAVINLRKYYPWYTRDEFIEVSDEVAAVLADSIRLECNYAERVRQNKAYFSLNAGDGIEREACYINMTPHEIYEHELLRCRLCQALNSLPASMGRRVEAYYLFGMSKADIARAEGVWENAVRYSIRRGIRAMKKYFEKF